MYTTTHIYTSSTPSNPPAPHRLSFHPLLRVSVRLRIHSHAMIIFFFWGGGSVASFVLHSTSRPSLFTHLTLTFPILLYPITHLHTNTHFRVTPTRSRDSKNYLYSSHLRTVLPLTYVYIFPSFSFSSLFGSWYSFSLTVACEVQMRSRLCAMESSSVWGCRASISRNRRESRVREVGEAHVLPPNRTQGPDGPSPAHTSVNDDNFPPLYFMIFSSSFRILEKDSRLAILMCSLCV